MNCPKLLLLLLKISAYLIHYNNAYRTVKVNGMQTLFAKEGEEIRIVCEDQVPLVRCGLTRPNGTTILYSNLRTGTPECELIVAISNKDSGLWTCHIWPQFSPQEEMKKFIRLTIADKFAAINSEIVGKLGERVTLSCVTTERMVPLNHCYFRTPSGVKIILADEVTTKKAIMNKYYFPINKSLHRGDCAITIDGVSREDAGTWSCYGCIEDDNVQRTDEICLIVNESDSLTLERGARIAALDNVNDLKSILLIVIILVLLFIIFMYALARRWCFKKRVR